MQLTVFYQSLAAIATLILLGFFLGKRKTITMETNKTIANLLLIVGMPCALFQAFPDTFDVASLKIFLQAVMAGAIILVVAIIFTKKAFAPKWTGASYYQHQFAFIFNNTSFLGYPLTLAVFGKEALLPYSGFMMVFNLLLFSYGVWLFEREFKWKNIKDIFFNPNIVAVSLGFLNFLFSIKLPIFATQTIGYLANLTTPLSLIVVGVMLSQVQNWWLLLKKVRIFTTALLQLILMPAITCTIAWLLRLPAMTIQMLTMLQALPTATSLALFAEKYGGNKAEASQLVLISTLVSAVTLPIVMTVVGTIVK